MAYRFHFREELEIIDIDNEKVSLKIEGSPDPVCMLKERFDPRFWNLLEKGGILTWTVHEWNGKATSGFTVRYPMK